MIDKLPGDIILVMTRLLQGTDCMCLSRVCKYMGSIFTRSCGFTNLRVGQEIYYRVMNAWKLSRIKSIRITGHGKYCVGFNDKRMIFSKNIERFSHICKTKNPKKNIIITDDNNKEIAVRVIPHQIPILEHEPKIGQRVDALDTDLIWWEATIVDIVENNVVRVHYDQWSSKWDDNISLNSGRIAPYRTYTQEWRSRLSPNDPIEFKIGKRWYNGEICHIKNDEISIRHSFFSENNNFPIGSFDIAPLGSHTPKEGYRQKMLVYTCMAKGVHLKLGHLDIPMKEWYIIKYTKHK